LSWVHGPIPVRHTESGRGVPPSLLLVGWESSDDFQDALVPCLLRTVSLRLSVQSEFHTS
jgi:hypothetical protein